MKISISDCYWLEIVCALLVCSICLVWQWWTFDILLWLFSINLRRFDWNFLKFGHILSMQHWTYCTINDVIPVTAKFYVVMVFSLYGLCCVFMHQDFESNELEWEHREVELERTIVRLEKQQSEIASAASQVSMLNTAEIPSCSERANRLADVPLYITLSVLCTKKHHCMWNR